MNASLLGKRFARAAANLIGVPFRLRGRDPSKGLDCIGLVHAALVAIDRQPITPEGYRLRNSDPSRWLGYAELSGFQKSTGKLMIGDIALIETIDRLVNREGYTLKGARKALSSGTVEDAAPPEPSASDLLPRLRQIRDRLASALEA